MKLKNIASGDFVQIKNSLCHSELKAKQVCEVIDIDHTDKYGFDVLIQGKNCLDWVSHKHLKKPEPQIKRLDQSVFDGLDSKWKYAAVDGVGLLKAFTYEPKLSVTRTGFILLIGSTMDIGTGYDASNWRNSLIRRDTARKLTGSELCRAMLERGDKYVMCLVNNCGLYNTLQDEPSIVIHHCENGFYVRDSYYEYAMPVNNQGEPLTAAEVGL